jgi:hypothetical protein
VVRLLFADSSPPSRTTHPGTPVVSEQTALIANIGSQKGAGPAREKRLNGKAGRFLLIIAVLSGRYLLTCGPPRLVACAGAKPPDSPGRPRKTAASLLNRASFQRCDIGVVILARVCGKMTFTTPVLFVMRHP